MPQPVVFALLLFEQLRDAKEVNGEVEQFDDVSPQGYHLLRLLLRDAGMTSVLFTICIKTNSSLLNLRACFSSGFLAWVGSKVIFHSTSGQIRGCDGKDV